MSLTPDNIDVHAWITKIFSIIGKKYDFIDNQGQVFSSKWKYLVMDSSEVSDESLLLLLSPILLSSSLPLTFWGPSLGTATPLACWQSCITKKFIPRVNDTCQLTGFSHTGLEREQLEQTQGRTPLKQDVEWKWDSSPGLSYQGNGCLPHEHAV